jgi:hypothetical protein
MLDQYHVDVALDRHRQLRDDALRAASLRADHGDPPPALPAYAPLLAHLGAALLAAGLALRNRYAGGGSFADEGAPEGAPFARSLR